MGNSLGRLRLDKIPIRCEHEESLTRGTFHRVLPLFCIRMRVSFDFPRNLRDAFGLSSEMTHKRASNSSIVFVHSD